MGVQKSAQTLDPRQKGDIYWRKLKRFLLAEEERGIVHDEEKLIASQVYKECIEMGDLSKIHAEPITGREFKQIPPTAAARELYKNGIINVILRERNLSGEDPEEANLSHIIKKAVKVFYNAAGIDENSGKPVSQEVREEAMNAGLSVYKEYEKAVCNIRRNRSISFVKQLLKDEKIELKASFSDEVVDLLKKVSSSEDEGFLENVHKEYCALMGKKLELEARLSRAKELVSGSVKDESLRGSLTPEEAYYEYESYVREEMRALSFAINGCLSFVKSLVTGETVPPLYASYIENHFGRKVPSFDLDQKVYLLPGFALSEGDGSDGPKVRVCSIEDIKKVFDKLNTYRESHKNQFEDQIPTSLLLDIQGIPAFLNMARALRDSMAVMIGQGERNRLSEEEKKEFDSIFVTVDSYAAIASYILEYAELSKTKTVSDLFKDYDSFIYGLDINNQERISKKRYGMILNREGVGHVH